MRDRMAWMALGAAVTLAPFSRDLTATSLNIPIVPTLALVGALVTLWGLVLTFVFPKGPQKIRLSRLMFWRR